MYRLPVTAIIKESKTSDGAPLLHRCDVLRLGAGAVLASARGTRPAMKRMDNRHNILLVHCHDLGVYLHCYGAPTVRSPHLDAFAEQGVRFANSYCTAPQCSPSRASIFTGRYPHNNGVMGLCHANFAWDLHPDERHLAQILHEGGRTSVRPSRGTASAGYGTEAVGIIHETKSGAERCGYERHVDEARASAATDAAVERLHHFSQNPDRPFFLSVGFVEPHRNPSRHRLDHMGFRSDEFGPDAQLGVDVPGYLRDTEGTRTELAELQGAIHHVDTQFGRLMAAVADLGLDETTLVIFTTDHGYAMPRAKCSLYDPGIAVAFILRWPARTGWHGGLVRDEMISNIDYLPTLLDLLEIPIPGNVQGRSFAPLLDGAPYTPRDEIFAEISHHDYYSPRRCIRTKSHKLIVNFSSAPRFMDPSQSWRPRSDTALEGNNVLKGHDNIELYDLRQDVWELNNVADEPGYWATRRDLMTRLRRHLVETEDPILQGAITPPFHWKALELLEQEGG